VNHLIDTSLSCPRVLRSTVASPRQIPWRAGAHRRYNVRVMNGAVPRGPNGLSRKLRGSRSSARGVGASFTARWGTARGSRAAMRPLHAETGATRQSGSCRARRFVGLDPREEWTRWRAAGAERTHRATRTNGGLFLRAKGVRAIRTIFRHPVSRKTNPPIHPHWPGSGSTDGARRIDPQAGDLFQEGTTPSAPAEVRAYLPTGARPVAYHSYVFFAGYV
jgi:hypothetical protein